MKDKLFRICDYIAEYSIYGLIFFIPISKAGIEILFGLAFFAFLVKKIIKPDFSFLRNPAHFFLLLFIAFNALSLLNSGIYLKKSFIALIFKWLEYILMFIVVEDTFNARPQRIRNALIVFLCGGALICIDGSYQYSAGSDFIRHKKLIPMVNGGTAVTASFQHYNDFGTYLIVVFSLVISLLLNHIKQFGYKLLLWLLVVLATICLFLSFSRGAWLSLFVTLLLIFILAGKPKKVVIAMALVLMVIYLLPGVKERALITFYPKGDADRFIMWKATFRMIGENPFLGKGIGTYMDYFHRYVPDKVIQYAHNCFLQIWAETGIFSLLSFCTFLFLLMRSALRIFRKNKDFALLGLWCGIFGFLVHSLLDTQFYSLQLSALFWTTAGILQAICWNYQREQYKQEHSP